MASKIRQIFSATVRRHLLVCLYHHLDPREAAQEEGFRILFESGNDLTVISCRSF